MTTDDEFEALKALIERCDRSTRERVAAWLREQFPIHPLEQEFGVSAEVILEAIHRSSDLSKRGIRGLITEASFKVDVLQAIPGLQDITPPGNHSYDFQLSFGRTEAAIQVKMQRKKEQRPMRANEAYRWLDPTRYVVETQRTRAGRRPGAESGTRPYRFGEFDILAVSLEPATRDWKNFRYTVARWLIPDRNDPSCLLKFQPVAATPDEDWTDDLLVCLRWLEDGVEKTIGGWHGSTPR